jgi:hypothetical protein
MMKNRIYRIIILSGVALFMLTLLIFVFLIFPYPVYAFCVSILYTFVDLDLLDPDVADFFIIQIGL